MYYLIQQLGAGATIPGPGGVTALNSAALKPPGAADTLFHNVPHHNLQRGFRLLDDRHLLDAVRFRDERHGCRARKARPFLVILLLWHKKGTVVGRERPGLSVRCCCSGARKALLQSQKGPAFTSTCGPHLTSAGTKKGTALAPQRPCCS